METNRLEAFSDGVFAIAITLLVLDLRVPVGAEHDLAAALLRRWPNYASYVVSFLVIGIIWVNHHAMFRQIAQADRPLLFMNLLLLLFVAAIPFPTALLAEYIRSGSASHVAAAAYSAVMFLMGVSFNTMWRWVVRDGRLLHAAIDPAQARATVRRFGAGMVVYALLIGVAFVSALLTLALHFLVAVYYVVDQLTVAKA